MTTTSTPVCRVCGDALRQTLVDLGQQPLANSYLDDLTLAREEVRYPLHVRVCGTCFLAQLDHAVPPDAIFSDYAYFSSYSDSWLAHAEKFAQVATDRFQLSGDDLVLEIASNDGYLLKFFARLGCKVLGVEPARNVAEVAQAAGIPTDVRFFGSEVARDLRQRGTAPKLIVANNVLAHVPDLNDFVGGLRELATDETTISIEVPHLLNLIEEVQFDTIYHEHFSYFSLLAAEEAFRRAGLRVVDVERLPTHGGSLRMFVVREGSSAVELPSVEIVRRGERSAGLDRLETYGDFAPKVEACRQSLLAFLAERRQAGERVAAYGAAAKGNTLLNFCDVTTDQIDYVVDRSPHKQGRFLPGSHLPIHGPDRLFDDRPEYILVLPWNLAAEVAQQLEGVREWGGRLAVAIPTVRLIS